MSVNVRKVIHDNIENSRFYIIIDEAKDEEKKTNGNYLIIC